jgi:hypothetical protein
VRRGYGLKVKGKKKNSNAIAMQCSMMAASSLQKAKCLFFLAERSVAWDL